MIKGIKSLPNGDFCAYCNAKINLDLYDFCPKCGNPLSDNAIKLREKQDERIKFGVLDDLSSGISDPNVLKAISDYLKK
ncbi:MAG: hypothetical protein J6T74_03845 [Clostridia bacterium]|nr:hypothetical protein [Clostridia bacterium]